MVQWKAYTLANTHLDLVFTWRLEENPMSKNGCKRIVRDLG